MTFADGAALRTSVAHLPVDPEVLDTESRVVPATDDAHHLRRVLRVRDGEEVTVTDRRGRWRPAAAVVDGTTLWLEPIGQVVEVPPPSPRLVLAVAVPKGDRFDWMIQKVCELGVWSVRLLDTERSIVRWKPERVGGHVARARRVADAACRQSRRVWWPTIDAPIRAADIVPWAFVAEPGGRPLLDVVTSPSPPEEVVVAVGPEGGWSPTELSAAAATVTLGPHVLRTETAAIAVAALFAGAAVRSLE